jgi:hypothetical protein
VAVLAVGPAARAAAGDARAQLRGGTREVGRAVRAGLGPALMGAAIPALWAVAVPALAGLLVGPRVLVGLLAGGILGATLLAVAGANAGSIWAKCEASIAHEGQLGGAGSEAHRASWAGARLGGALRDVAGPTALAAMKAAAATALLMAPLIFVDKDTGLGTLDGQARRPPANERQLFACAAGDGWWRDGYASGSQFRECVRARTAAGAGSVLSCFDWDRAYWGALPGAFLAAATLLVFLRFWRAAAPKDPPAPPGAPPARMQQPMLLGMPGGASRPSPQYAMRGPGLEFAPIQSTQTLPAQVGPARRAARRAAVGFPALCPPRTLPA